MGSAKTQNGKNSTSATASRKNYDPRKAGEFVGEVKAELKRISWTTREELKVYTKIVVGATFVIGIGLYFIDIFMRRAVTILGVLFHWIFG